MSGYVRSKHLTFRFDDDNEPELKGLVIRTKRVSIDLMREIMRLDRKVDNPDDLSEEELFERFERPFEIFADALVSWNLQEEDDGSDPVDVPPTREALLADVPWSMRLVRAWMRAVTSVARDLGKDSSSGETSDPVPSLPMEPLSENRQSSPTPS